MTQKEIKNNSNSKNKYKTIQLIVNDISRSISNH